MVAMRQENDLYLLPESVAYRPGISYEGRHVDKHYSNAVLPYMIYKGRSILPDVKHAIIFHPKLYPDPMEIVLCIGNIIVLQDQVIYSRNNMAELLGT